jgi:hypothetical protein
VITDKSDVPFGFAVDSSDMLPANRAQRFLDDGPGESMFLLVTSMDELLPRSAPDAPDLPVLPSLRSKREAEACAVLWRPLLEGDLDDVPVIAYGHDGTHAFGLLLRTEHEPRAEAVHAEAMANVRAQDVQVEELDDDELVVLAVSGSFFATEKLLDRGFMRDLHDRLGAPLLAVGVPRRGLMLVASAMHDPKHLVGFRAMVEDEHEEGGGRAISEVVLLVEDGVPTGIATLDQPVPKRPGFFARLLGKKS